MSAPRLPLRARYDWGWGTVSASALLWVFFALFLAYPLAQAVYQAFVVDGRFSLTFFRLIATNPVQQQAVVNSLNLGIVSTIVTTLIALPLAYAMANFRFRGKVWLQALLLVPMVMPPFVGAIGMRQFFARFGSVNLLLMKLGVIGEPIDWFGGGGFLGVVILEALHLYPIMYLNVAAALANVDPSLEEAAQNLGASRWKVFRTVTFPLMLPGYFAGAAIVFIWAFTDLGTPLIFHYRNVVAVQIFEKVGDQRVNPMGYALVVLVAALTLVFFYILEAVRGWPTIRDVLSRARRRPRAGADLAGRPGHLRGVPGDHWAGHAAPPLGHTHLDHQALVHDGAAHGDHGPLLRPDPHPRPDTAEHPQQPDVQRPEHGD